MIYQQAAIKAHHIAETAATEAKLQIGLEEILRELLSDQGINYNPAVNETLSNLGLSQTSSNRPDSLFGYVVLDYKEPGLLSDPRKLSFAKEQIERYLNEVTGGGPSFNPVEVNKWAGVLWDGFHLIFCHSVGLEWSWTKLHETSEASLLSLVQIYRSLNRLPLTPQLLTRYFGKNSDLAKIVLPILANQLSKPKHRTHLLFNEWKRLFQQVSTYGLAQLPSLREWSRRNGIATRDASQILFAIHTYYSLVVKILTAELLAASQTNNNISIIDIIANSPNDQMLYKELMKLENGDYFRRFRINNFLEGDFFSWYTNEESHLLAMSIRDIARTLLEFEPATAKLKPEIVKDLLKEFYSSLVDEQIRHDLGEYYTPDWLAEYLLDKLGYSGNINQVIIDPACGSGTFIIECIKRMRMKCADAKFTTLQTLDAILHSIRGLDLNPLAIISARANYILAISDLVFSSGHDIEIPIYLADSINIPEEKPDGLLEYTLDTEVGEVKFNFPLSLVKEQVLGKILIKCEDYIYHNSSPETFWSSLENDKTLKHLLDDKAKKCIISFYEEIQALNNRKPPWDSIWCRIVKNNFSPRGFENVDFIVGNPPWVRWSRLPETYRKRVKRFCDHYGLLSGKSYTGGIESDISTILTYSAVDNWLKIGGKIGFLITSTVFKSASATGFRLGRLPDKSGIRIDHIEDLSKIQPFPDASNETSIFIATKVESSQEATFSAVPCVIWNPTKSSRIPPYLSLSEVKENISFIDGEACPVGIFGSPLFMGKKDEFNEVSELRGNSPNYFSKSHRGTVTDSARIYWVKVEKYSKDTNRAWIRTLSNSELPMARDVEHFEGWIEADILFPLIRGRDIGRYCTKTEGWYQIIPNNHYSQFEHEEEFANNYPATYSYLLNYKETLLQRSTYKRYQSRLPFYSIYCIGQYSFHPYKVVWLEQQNPKSFRASVLTQNENSIIPNKIIIPDHKIYFTVTNSLVEAHYLCGFLNSHPVRTWLGGFLLGKQIGTSIFEYMNVPLYNPLNEQHKTISKISQNEHLYKDSNKIFNNDYLQQENELQSLVKNILHSE